ncbi:hypothetical protein KCU78_g9120, partial [Aureobasidium melanogenum]
MSSPLRLSTFFARSTTMATSALLDDWYLRNHFVVDFEIALSARNRSQLEKAMRLVSPRVRALLLTPVPVTISPHLQIRIRMSETCMTFASLLQWFRLFYDGLLSKAELEKTGDAGLGTGPPMPTNWQIDRDRSSILVLDEMCVGHVIYGLR